MRKYATSVEVPPINVDHLVVAVHNADLKAEFIIAINESFAIIEDFITHLKTVSRREDLFKGALSDDSVGDLVEYLITTHSPGIFAYLDPAVGGTFPIGDINVKFWNSI